MDATATRRADSPLHAISASIDAARTLSVRYAIVDEAMIREAAVKMNRGAKVRRTTAQRTAQSGETTADR
jgi:hypothetical protein